MRARELHGQLITPTHRPEEKGGFFSGLRNSLIPPECSWGPLLKYASGSSPSFIECRDAGGEGRCIELRKHTETMGGGKRWKCHQSGTYCGSNSGVVTPSLE